MFNPRLGWQIYSMEIRRAFAYRSDFWLAFIVSTLAQFVVAWFLWKSIFAYKGISTIGTFTFQSLMFYYLLVPIIGRTVFGGNMGDIASEIYQGSLTRYLVYPVSFIRYKLLMHFANATILLMQLLMVMGLVLLFFPSFASGYTITFPGIALGIVTLAMSTLLYFIFSSTIQLIAFWADNVWSLSAILRFITSLLGGSLIPLSLFPDTLQPLLALLPFSCFITLPMQAFLGKLTVASWLQGSAMLVFWGIICGGCYAILWQRGNRHYAGVGI